MRNPGQNIQDLCASIYWEQVCYCAQVDSHFMSQYKIVELDLGSKGHKFKTHQWHCIVSLSKALYLLFSTGSLKTGNCPDMTEKLFIGM